MAWERSARPSARTSGVEIRVNAPVARISVENGRAPKGVVLQSGEAIGARALANTRSKAHLPRRVRASRRRIRRSHQASSDGACLAAAHEPRAARRNSPLTSGEDANIALGSAITLLPDRRRGTRNWRLAQDGELPAEPYVNMQIARCWTTARHPTGPSRYELAVQVLSLPAR